MLNDHDSNDAIRHRNLERIGRALPLPPSADADRQARWQNAGLTPGAVHPGRGVWNMKRYTRTALATTGIAAALAAAVWFGLGPANIVSAATVFESFRSALAQSLSIHIDGIQFEQASIEGDIIVDRSGEPGAETRYAEVHVLLAADNPQWNDLDAVLAICQSPSEAWQYGRGSGGMYSGVGQVAMTEYLVRGQSWRDFARQPLDHFGSMPSELGFGSEESSVTYRFTREQRIVVEQLLRFLLDLTNAETAGQVIANVQDSAGDVRVERIEKDSYVLHASRFTQLGDLAFVKRTAPDVGDLVRQAVYTFGYDPTSKRILSTQFAPPTELYETGVAISRDTAEFPLDTPEALVPFLRERAVTVEADQSNKDEWVIRVTGYPFATDSSGLEWLGDYLTALRDSLTLTIEYDAAASAVRRAEFRGIGPSDGRVTLDLGPVILDPQRLRSESWVTPQTKIIGR
ncbi:MAG: hypothetical protein JXB13_20755 [Phycisphaerae bacterium]|nr:hypothetical protein [Phycisphaerae bacterium]